MVTATEAISHLNGGVSLATVTVPLVIRGKRACSERMMRPATCSSSCEGTAISAAIMS